jgi:PIN domain nuclease of toxin-antitoxin system
VIVLDTHALVWWVSGDGRLSARARDLIEQTVASAGQQVLVSAISAWEIAMLVERGRIALAMDLDEWLVALESLEGVTLVPVSVQVAVQSATLPGTFHKDPADRMIVALAREQNAVLVTADENIQRYPHVRWHW